MFKHQTGLSILAFTLFFAIFYSCKKYEEGPILTLRTRKARVVNFWYVKKHIVKGIESPGNYYDTYEFNKDGKFTITVGTIPTVKEGTWEFVENDNGIKLTLSDRPEASFIAITKLKEDEFWFKQQVNGEMEEFQLAPGK